MTFENIGVHTQVASVQRQRINARAKGRRGEQEVATILRGWVNEVYQELGLPEADMPKIERNLMQWAAGHRAKGNCDLVGLDWLALEVKRVENESNHNLTSWWEQTKAQARPDQEPVLFWRLNDKHWNVKMFAYVEAGPTRIRLPVVITSPLFAVWFKHRLRYALQ